MAISPNERIFKAMQLLGNAYGYSDIDKERMKARAMGSIHEAGQNIHAQAGYYGGIQAQNMNTYQQPTLSGLERQAGMAAKNKIDQLQKALTPKPQEKKGMFKYVKEYLEEHKAVVMPVLLVILADHFLLGGAFRERLKAVLSKLLAGAEKKIDALTGPTEVK